MTDPDFFEAAHAAMEPVEAPKMRIVRKRRWWITVALTVAKALNYRSGKPRDPST